MTNLWWQRACPSVHNAGGCRQTWQWEDASRVLNDHELFLFGRGFSGSIEAGGQSLSIRGPAWALVPPGLPHACHGEPSGAHRRWTHFDWDGARSEVRPLFNYDAPAFRPSGGAAPPWAPSAFACGSLADEALIREHLLITAAWARGGAAGTVRARCLLLELLARIFAGEASEGDQPGRVLAERVRLRLERIAALPAARTPALPQALAGLGHGADHLARTFRAVFGVPPVRYLQEQRVARACALLRGGMSLVGAAHALGFQDRDYLSRLISRRSGRTATWHRHGAAAD